MRKSSLTAWMSSRSNVVYDNGGPATTIVRPSTPRVTTPLQGREILSCPSPPHPNPQWIFIPASSSQQGLFMVFLSNKGVSASLEGIQNDLGATPGPRHYKEDKSGRALRLSYNQATGAGHPSEQCLICLL